MYFSKTIYRQFCYGFTVFDLWKFFQIIKQFCSSIKSMNKNKSNKYPDANKAAYCFS